MSSAVLILGAGHLPDRQLGPAPLLHDHPLDLPAGSDLAIQRLIDHYRFLCCKLPCLINESRVVCLSFLLHLVVYVNSSQV